MRVRVPPFWLVRVSPEESTGAGGYEFLRVLSPKGREGTRKEEGRVRKAGREGTGKGAALDHPDSQNGPYVK